MSVWDSISIIYVVHRFSKIVVGLLLFCIGFLVYQAFTAEQLFYGLGVFFVIISIIALIMAFYLYQHGKKIEAEQQETRRIEAEKNKVKYVIIK